MEEDDSMITSPSKKVVKSSMKRPHEDSEDEDVKYFIELFQSFNLTDNAVEINRKFAECKTAIKRVILNFTGEDAHFVFKNNFMRYMYEFEHAIQGIERIDRSEFLQILHMNIKTNYVFESCLNTFREVLSDFIPTLVVSFFGLALHYFSLFQDPCKESRGFQNVDNVFYKICLVLHEHMQVAHLFFNTDKREAEKVDQEFLKISGFNIPTKNLAFLRVSIIEYAIHCIDEYLQEVKEEQIQMLRDKLSIYLNDVVCKNVQETTCQIRTVDEDFVEKIRHSFKSAKPLIKSRRSVVFAGIKPFEFSHDQDTSVPCSIKFCYVLEQIFSVNFTQIQHSSDLCKSIFKNLDYPSFDYIKDHMNMHGVITNSYFDNLLRALVVSEREEMLHGIFHGMEKNLVQKFENYTSFEVLITRCCMINEQHPAIDTIFTNSRKAGGENNPLLKGTISFQKYIIPVNDGAHFYLIYAVKQEEKFDVYVVDSLFDSHDMQVIRKVLRVFGNFFVPNTIHRNVDDFARKFDCIVHKQYHSMCGHYAIFNCISIATMGKTLSERYSKEKIYVYVKRLWKFGMLANKLKGMQEACNEINKLLINSLPEATLTQESTPDEDQVTIQNFTQDLVQKFLNASATFDAHKKETTTLTLQYGIISDLEVFGNIWMHIDDVIDKYSENKEYLGENQYFNMGDFYCPLILSSQTDIAKWRETINEEFQENTFADILKWVIYYRQFQSMDICDADI